MIGWKRNKVFTILLISAAVGMLIGSVGCGRRQGDEIGDAGQITTGAAIQVDGNIDSEAIQHQLELLVKNAHKWRRLGDEETNMETGISYAVTDLDHNGRLEILAEDIYKGTDFTRCYEVNESGDDIEEINTDQAGKDCLYWLYDSDTAYYDPKTGEYHYVMQYEDDMAKEDIDVEEIEDEGWVNALTLKEGKITRDTLGYWVMIDKQEGRSENRYYHVDDMSKKDIMKEQYTVEKPEDAIYSGCGELSVGVSTFQFDHNREEMTEKQMYHALEKSYGEFFQGHPLEKQNKTIHGCQIAVPQYTTIQDSGKQKRINQMICDWVEQSLNYTEDSSVLDREYSLEYADITIEYAGRGRVSLLLETREGVDRFSDNCDTITVDLEQEKILTGEDILPEQYREEMEEDILYGCCSGYHGGDDYQEAMEKEGKEKLFPTQAADGWQDVKVYQTAYGVGVVLPVKFGLDSYVIYENCWSDLYMDSDDRAAYSDVDWEAYQYKLLAPEYQRLQDYMPVLMGKTDVTWENESTSEDGENNKERRNISVPHFLEEYCGSDMEWKDYTLYSISLCDLTQDGQLDLILEFVGLKLILHQEGEQFYGKSFGSRSFESVTKDGIYEEYGGASWCHYYQMHFDGDTFVTEEVAGQEGNDYYIGKKKVEEKKISKWIDDNICADDKQVCRYHPEKLQKGSGESE